MLWALAMDYAYDKAQFETEVNAAAREARTAKDDSRTLRIQLERTVLACEAMWSILKEKLAVTDVELAQRVNEIDLSDGHLDGKLRRTPMSCPSCNRTISPRFPKCMYCGQDVVHKPFA